jgi:hypothetical protein
VVAVKCGNVISTSRRDIKYAFLNSRLGRWDLGCWMCKSNTHQFRWKVEAITGGRGGLYKPQAQLSQNGKEGGIQISSDVG